METASGATDAARTAPRSGLSGRRTGRGDPTGPVPVLGRLLWLFVPGVVAAGMACLPLSWDGSYFLVDLLDHGRPVMLHGRPSMVLFQVPGSLAGHVLSDTTLIGFVFSVPYVLVPVVALALSWWVVRSRRPGLVVWPAVAIGFITLPGQAFFVSESTMVGQLVWPLLVGVLVGHRWNRLVLAAFLAFLVLLHPMAAPGLGLVAVVAAVVAWRAPERRGAAKADVAVYAGAAVVRQALTFAGLDAETPKVHDITHQWTWAVNGAPLAVVVAVTLACALGVFALVRRRSTEAGSSDRVTRWCVAGAALSGVVGAIVAVGWGADDHAWRSALDYRSFVVVLALPVAVCAVVDALGHPAGSSAADDGAGEHVPPTEGGPSVDRRTDREVHRARAAAVALCGLAFSLTLIAQSVGWAGLVTYARDDLARQTEPCVVRHVAEKDGTAMRHWANPSLALLVQGRRPDVVVVGEEGSCARLAATGELVLPRTGKDRNVFSHWFDLSQVRAALRQDG